MEAVELRKWDEREEKSWKMRRAEGCRKKQSKTSFRGVSIVCEFVTDFGR